MIPVIAVSVAFIMFGVMVFAGICKDLGIMDECNDPEKYRE